MKKQTPLRNHGFPDSLPVGSTVKAAHFAAHQDPAILI